MPESHDSTPGYRYGPLEQHGFWMGLGVGQVAVVVIGAGSLVVFLRFVSQPVAAVAIDLATLSIAFVPVRGKTVEQWIPIVGLWCARGLAGQRHWLGQAISKVIASLSIL